MNDALLSVKHRAKAMQLKSNFSHCVTYVNVNPTYLILSPCPSLKLQYASRLHAITANNLKPRLELWEQLNQFQLEAKL